MNKLLDWLSNKFLPYFVAFLLVFIPLFPKWPLFDVSHTWVYIRTEDLLIGFAAAVWALLWFRKKVHFVPTMTVPIFAFWVVGLISTIFAIFFIFPNIANVFPFVAVLHYLRRVEYLILFFIAASTIKSSSDLFKYIVALIVAVIGVVVYGIGQKLGALPAYLTMNEEFAKGLPLYLPEGARITSTFAGHYDLAAFLVMMIVLLFSLFFGIKNIIVKLLLLSLSVACLFILLFTASRVSFGVYLATITFMLILQKKKLFIIPVIIVSLLLLAQVKGTAERFAKTIRIQPIVINSKTGQPVAILEKLPPEISGLRPTPTPEETLPLGSGFIGLPPVVSDEEPEATSVAVIRKSVSQSLKLADNSSEISTISGSFLIQKAFVYDISFTTRFQGGWPRAWNAFQRNILLGSGYSSIDLASDNDYLRMLGETGILGLMAFFFIFSTYYLVVKKNWSKLTSPLEKSFVIGVSAGVFGLFLNAVLIDVFEASKVAQVLWILMGLAVGVIYLRSTSKINLWQETLTLITSNVFLLLYLFLISFYAFANILPNYFTGEDFPWLKAAANLQSGNFWLNFLSGSTTFAPFTKFLYFALYAVFWLKSFGYHLMSIFLFFVSSTAIFLITQKLYGRKILSFGAAVLFLVLPINHQFVAPISAYGIMLATCLTLFSLYFFILRKQLNYLWSALLSGAFYILSLLSLESALLLPVLILVTGVLQEKTSFFKNRQNLLFLFFLVTVTIGYFMLRQAFVPNNILFNFVKLFQHDLMFLTATLSLILGAGILSMLTKKLLVNSKTLINIILIVVIFLLAMASKWQLSNELTYWSRAAETSRKIIYSIKDNFKIFPTNSELIFANLPTKIGNAGVYQTGLDDAFWFVYRDETLRFKLVPQKEDFPPFTDGESNVYRFVFEGNQLKSLTQE